MLNHANNKNNNIFKKYYSKNLTKIYISHKSKDKMDNNFRVFFEFFTTRKHMDKPL
jgi:intergrase/recombinase